MNFNDLIKNKFQYNKSWSEKDLFKNAHKIFLNNFHKIFIKYDNCVNILLPSDNYVVTKYDFNYILFNCMHIYAHTEIYYNLRPVCKWVSPFGPTKVSL